MTTHAQGAERGAEGFDKYPVTLRVRAGRGRESVTLSPEELRAALAAYMVRIPPEPSPYVAPGRRALAREARAGLALFRDRCAGCHLLVGDSARGDRVPARDLERRLLAGEVALTDARLHAVGTPILGNGGNNPPSLRGVWEAAPYFSDGSARTLEEVLRRTDPDARAVHAAANATRPPAFTAGERRRCWRSCARCSAARPPAYGPPGPPVSCSLRVTRSSRHLLSPGYDSLLTRSPARALARSRARRRSPLRADAHAAPRPSVFPRVSFFGASAALRNSSAADAPKKARKRTKRSGETRGWPRARGGGRRLG